MELKSPDQIVLQRAALVHAAGQQFIDVLTAETFVEALHSLALQTRLAVGAHQCAISYLPGGDFQRAIHTKSLSDKYRQYDSYDVTPTGEGITGLVVRQKNAVRMTEQEVLSHPMWKNFSGLRDARGLEHPPMRGWLAAPVLSATGVVLGVLQLSDKFDDADFTSADLDLLIHVARMVSVTFKLQHANQELAKRNEELRNAEAATSAGRMLRLVLDNIPLGVFWKDRHSRYLGCNEVVARAWELTSPEAIIGLTDYQLPGLAREQADFFIACDRRVMDQNQPELGIVEQATLADGSTIWMETNKIPMLDPAGAVVGILGTWQDITERKRAEQELAQEQAISRSFMEHLPGLFFWLDDTGRFIRWNKNIETVSGYSADEINRLGALDFIVDDDKGLVYQRILEVFQHGLAEVETQLLTKDGQRIPYFFKGVRLILQDRPFLVGVGVDTTDRRLAAEALRESEAFLRMSQQVGKVGSWQWDLRTNQVRWSEAMYPIYGVAPGEFDGTLENATRFTHPDDLEAMRDIIQCIVERGESRPMESRIIRPDGQIAHIWGFGEVIRDAAGRPIQCVGTVMDITERKRAEEERRRFESQIQHAQKLESLGVLAGGIAHDFNNLLTSILSYSELAKRTLPPGSTARSHIEAVVKGTQRAAAYSGKGRFVIQPLSLSAVVEDMGRLLEVSISKKCRLRFRFMPDLPTIEADATQLRQVIMNLIINASDAMGDRGGSIEVSTGVVDCDRAYLAETYLDENLPEGHYVFLEVSDSGCGMTAETKAKLFDPFFTTKFTGRGLGLAAVLGIVRGHHGAIKVSSEVGKGTCFKVLFPALTAPAQLESEPKEEESAWRGGGLALVIDDEELVREATRAVLEVMGFEVLLAADGYEAIDIFRRESDRIRLIMLDMTMPGIDGAQTFEELQRVRPGVPTVLCSGYNEQTATNRFVGKGLAAFVQKPCPYQQLVEVIRKATERA